MEKYIHGDLEQQGSLEMEEEQVVIIQYKQILKMYKKHLQEDYM